MIQPRGRSYVMKHGQWTNVTLRELAWLAAFVFWAYYKKPADTSFLQIRLDPIGFIGLGLVIAGIVVQFLECNGLDDGYRQSERPQQCSGE